MGHWGKGANREGRGYDDTPEERRLLLIELTGKREGLGASLASGVWVWVWAWVLINLSAKPGVAYTALRQTSGPAVRESQMPEAPSNGQAHGTG